MPSRTRPSFHSARYRAFLRLLKQARLDAGLTQVEVSAALGRPQSFVSKCESGERRVDVIELGEFAKLYRKPVTFFLRAAGR
jgi:transcriptional regulator with XRE-family HTH domain